jgi:hypothetical protein
VLLALLAPLLIASGEMPEFRVVDLGPLGRVTQLSYSDLDGDGRTEVLVFRGHRLAVYAPDDKGAYPTAKPVEIELDPDALFYEVAQVDRVEKTLEVTLATPRGILVHSMEEGRLSGEPKLLLAAESLVLRGQEDDMHWRGFLRDLNGDGLADAVLPTSRGFALYYQARDENGPGVWPKKPDRLVPYTLVSSFDPGERGLAGRLRGRTEVPDFRVIDFDADGKRDFVVDDGKRLRIFFAGKDGRLGEERPQIVDLSPLADAAGGLPPLSILDVSGDRIPDFVLSRQREGITDVFLGGAPLGAPSLRIKITGWSFPPRLTDLDGDGRVDLVVPTTPEVDVPTAVSVMMTGRITVSNHVFLNRGDAEKPFAKEPDEIREIDVRIRLFVDRVGRIRAAHSVLVDESGDFDNDGRKDLLYREGTDEIRIYAGTEKGVFARSDARTVRIPDTAAHSALSSRTRDLNGDGVPDVAIFYQSGDRTADRIVLLLSGKGDGK